MLTATFIPLELYRNDLAIISSNSVTYSQSRIEKQIVRYCR